MRDERRFLGLLIGATLLWACSPGGPPPYDLQAQPNQRFRFEAEESIEVDGAPATIQRYADFELRAQPEAAGPTPVELFLERYYTRVEGAPGGTTEFSLSERGLSSVTPREGTQTLGPESAGPGGGTIEQLRHLPVAGAGFASDGSLAVELWQSSNPLLFGVHLLDWLILALPPNAGSDDESWKGSRELPQMGQYRVGIELPLLYRRDPEVALGVQATGSVQRPLLRIASGLEGAIQLDYVGRAVFSEPGALLDATLELRMRFESTQGETISSEHRVRIRSLSEEEPVNPHPDEADTSNAT